MSSSNDEKPHPEEVTPADGEHPPLASDEERTATGRNPDRERAGAWAASGELAQRPTPRRRVEEQLAVESVESPPGPDALEEAERPDNESGDTAHHAQ